jgi:hypothetical protein
MATPDEARAVAAQAVEDARMRMLERGLNPNDYPRLPEALRRAIEQVIGARELGEDVESRRRYLDAVLMRSTLPSRPWRNRRPHSRHESRS